MYCDVRTVIGVEFVDWGSTSNQEWLCKIGDGW